MTAAAVKRLQALGLTTANVLLISDEILEKAIYPVGFWRKKVIIHLHCSRLTQFSLCQTQYLKKVAAILEEQYGGDIPRTLAGLMALPGVGTKMATICMAAANREVTGIGVLYRPYKGTLFI